jgi:undecaprenyl-diphosphatase
MTIFETLVIAIVEGLTEFLPISSTGHMIIASSIMHISEDDFTKLFEVSHTVWRHPFCGGVVLEKIFSLNRLNFYFKLIVAVIPRWYWARSSQKKLMHCLKAR